MKQEKWSYNPAEQINDKYGYSTDVFKNEISNVENDICQVWGKTEKECNDRANFISTSLRMYDFIYACECDLNYKTFPKFIREAKNILQSIKS